MRLLNNYPLVAAFCAIFFAQFVKFPIAYFSKKKGASISLVTSTGGMPSSHSAAVTSLITALGLEHGFASPLVAIATTFGVIVMFDSMGVRRQSGEQGILLSKLYEEYQNKTQSSLPNITIDQEDSTQNLFEQDDSFIIKKYLGHKPLEVLAGAATGVFIAFCLSLFYFQ